MSARTFDEAVNGAWRQFRESMAQQLQAMPEGEFWRVEVVGDEPDDGALPYVQVMAGGDGSFWTEAVSNHYLADEARLRRPQQRALREMGWGPVARAVDGKPPAERHNYWLESSDAEWIAVLTMRALREVYGVVDPAFVEYAGVGPPAGRRGRGRRPRHADATAPAGGARRVDGQPRRPRRGRRLPDHDQ